MMTTEQIKQFKEFEAMMLNNMDELIKNGMLASMVSKIVDRSVGEEFKKILADMNSK